MKNSGILQNLYLKGFSKTYLVMVKRKMLVKIPVKFVGVGEGIDDIQPFVAEDFAAALFADVR